MSLLNLKKNIIDTIFPNFCLNCAKEGLLICPDCFGCIPISEYNFCPFCPKPRRVMKPGKCASHQSMKLNGLFTAVPYQDKIVKKMLRYFKYPPYLKGLAQPLAQLIIAHFLLSENKLIFHSQGQALLLPIPLWPKKEKQRGYNQSLLIAEQLSRAIQIPIFKNNLIKIKNTKPQVGLNREKRKENLWGAFAVRKPADFTGKIIFLIDDVFTTGSTMEECAKVIKQTGAKQVWGVAVAREGLSG